MSKRDCLTSYIDTCNPDIIALTETWLHPNIQDNELFDQANHFTVYRFDRDTRHGGGVLLAVRKEIPSSVVHLSNNIETVWAVVQIAHQKLFWECATVHPILHQASQMIYTI